MSLPKGGQAASASARRRASPGWKPELQRLQILPSGAKSFRKPEWRRTTSKMLLALSVSDLPVLREGPDAQRGVGERIVVGRGVSNAWAMRSWAQTCSTSTRAVSRLDWCSRPLQYARSGGMRGNWIAIIVLAGTNIIAQHAEVDVSQPDRRRTLGADAA